MPRGYTKLRDGRYRAWVRISAKAEGFDAPRYKRFPAETPLETIRAWRRETSDHLRQQLAQKRQTRQQRHGAPAGFTHEATRRYLPAVAALTTYEERVREIALWCAEFGDRDPMTIEPHEIRAVRDRWLTVGPKRVQEVVAGRRRWVDTPAPLSASTVNHRLRALSNLYTVLYPKADNPVRDVPEAAEPRAIPRSIAYETIRVILDAMPDRGRPTKGQPRPTDSLAKVRARVIAWAGLEPTELGRIAEADLQTAIETGVLVVPGRHKGEGAPGRVLPLSDDAVLALTDLVRLKATGPFSSRGVLRAWQRACVHVIGRPLRLKDLRHSYVTAIVAQTKDLKLAQRLAGHLDDRTTDRYALAALLPMLRAGIDATFPKKETP